jgi:hypothetical protein
MEVTMNAQPSFSTLVAIRAAHHPEATPTYDRVVFEFSGPVPLIEVQYVTELLGDGSGLPVPVMGNAILRLIMQPAQAHTDQGQPTVSTPILFALPNIKEVVTAGDFEGVLTYGIGLDHMTEIRVITLADASRVVVDFLNP